MAVSRVPPPPELEPDQFDFLSQQSYSSQRAPESKRGQPPTRGSYSHSHFERLHSNAVSQGLVQRVPETPSLRHTHHADATPSTLDRRLDVSFVDAGGGRECVGLRSVSEVSDRYRGVFKNFSHFNFVQSKVFDDVMYTDSPLVTSAPTGSGKTVIFELAIVRLLMQSSGNMTTGKIIYVAPIKALCSERFEDWRAKFSPLGLHCCELTGDSQLDDYFELQNSQIVMTTPVIMRIKEGKHPEPPSECPAHQLMLQCWNHNPKKRPHFEECSRQIEQLIDI